MTKLSTLTIAKKFALSPDVVQEDGTFEGYASVFGDLDLGQDIVERGAFAASLQERGTRGIKMLYQHDPSQPIGVWEDIREDEKGLFVKGRLLIDAVAKARETYALMKAGALDAMSIGYHVVRSATNSDNLVRHLQQIDLREISVVTFPMLPSAQVTGVKTGNTLPTVREFESLLLRDAGMTRTEAGALLPRYREVLAKRDAGAKGKTQAPVRYPRSLLSDLDRLSKAIS